MPQPRLHRSLAAFAVAVLVACAALPVAPAIAAAREPLPSSLASRRRVPAETTVAPSADAPFVYLDAGHGGPYSNANENGFAEKDINLAIALELRTRLAARGYRVGMTRTGDYALTTSDIPTWHWASDGPHLYADGSVPLDVPTDDLQARDNVANWAGADLFVSIHCNGVSDKGVTGIESYAPTFDPLGQRLAAYCQEEMISEVGAIDRGDKTTNFYVVRWANMPAILIEAGFLSNPLEAQRLGNGVYRWRLARAIARGVDRFFAEDPFKGVYPRIGGANRYETAALASQSGWPDGADTVLLANGTNWPDALAAAPLSRKLAAPLLLTAPTSLPAATAGELARLHPKRVVVLGAEPAVSASVAAEATAAATVGTASVEATRIGGPDRYATAALIAEQVGVPASGRVAVVSGADFPDALSLAPYAGVLGYPMLLASGPSLPAPSQAFVEAHRAEIRGTLVVGSTTAVPAEAVSALPSVSRVTGANRWETNANMVRTWGTRGPVALLVANGLDFPDGLVAGAYGARIGRPLVLVQPRVLHDRTREYLELNQERITALTIFGSPSAVPKLMDWELKKALD